MNPSLQVKRPPEYKIVIHPFGEVNAQQSANLTLIVKYPINYPDE